MTATVVLFLPELLIKHWVLAKKDKNTAILLLHCTDQKGIVAAVTDFLHKNEGNIISLDEHVDNDANHFFMRVEWELEGFSIPTDKIGDYFKTMIANRFDLKFEISCDTAPPRAAIFVSKYSHCLFDLLSRYESKEWNIEIPLIISNHEKFAYIGDRYDIPFYHCPKTKETAQAVEEKEYHLLKKHDVDFIILARYMRILSDDFCKRFENKIINIHHSSLPAFAGANPYRAAYQRGVKFMGATAHYVTAELDAGPIIHQDVIPISHVDSISDMKRKGRDIEKIVLATAVWSHINHKIITHQNKTVVFN